MANKILRNNAGVIESIAVVVTSAGAADDGKAVGLSDEGKLDMSVMPDGVANDTVSLPASEALVAGDFVNIFDDAGTIKVRKATNTTATRKADGFVKDAVIADANAVVYLEGANDKLTGLTLGTKYFLGVNGAVTATAPTAENTIIQPLGFVKGATKLRFEQNDYIKNV